jgi:acyl transferase domain-containing protein/acyl-CoA synthetase (AMP-forming)/AMP-acid ligase II/acyl carrier protein
MQRETPFSSLSHVLMNSAKSEKGITFIESNSSEDFLSYRELYNKAAHVLTQLQKQGLKPGYELIFQFQHNKHFVITFWACILGNIIPVPITFGISDEIMLKLFNIWKLLNHPFLITDLPGFMESICVLEQNMENREIISNLQGRIIYFDDVNVIYKKAVPISSDPNNITFIQYSSGSTGNPKGVINTHKGIIYNIQVMSDFFSIKDNDKILSWMPLSHDMGLIFFHILPLFNSAQQYLIPPIVFLTYPSLWMTKASDHQITISGSPNFGFRHYLDHFDEKTMYNRSLEHMKYLVNSAEPISFQVCQQFIHTLAKFKLNHNAIRPSYGLAEATLGVSTVPLSEQFSQHLVHRNYLKVGDEVRFVDAWDEHAVSFVDLGISLFNSIIITDEAGHQLPEKTIGYIKLQSPCVTPGYYNDPITTFKTINKDGWLDTGDLGFIYNQRLIIVGRAKEIVIINGQNYHPVDLERVAAELEGLREGKIVVTSVFNSKMKTEEILVFIAFKQYHQDLKEFMPLITQLRLHFIDKIGIEVHQIIPIKKIPVTTTGKIRRFELKERYLNGEFDEIIEKLNSLRQQMKPVKPDLSGIDLQKIIVIIYKDVLKLENISIYDKFFDLGGSSSNALRVRVKLEEALGKNIDNAVIFKYPTISALTDFLSSDDTGAKLHQGQIERLDAFKNERKRIRELTNKHISESEIAVIGMSGRFPGAKNIHEFWDNLKNGIESISFFSDEELSQCGVDLQVLNNPNYVKAKGVLEDIEYFDSVFFDYNPHEAEKMDPQMRLFHECSWEALEDAGYDPFKYKGLIGVYVGASPNPYWESKLFLSGEMSASEQFDDLHVGNKDFMTTRLSYKLNMQGPSFSMYTACSTSLVAIDLACQGLLSGKCDMALAGGISIWLPQKSGYLYEDGMLFSRGGHNLTFDERANGTVFSDGAGIVILKRLVDALTHRDHIYAVIKGTAINNDGDRKAGYTAPALEGQAEVIAAAQQMAGVEPGSIGYIETHGTATNLGDSIEIDALNLAFSASKTPPQKYCAIGSVKTNIGHLNAAAGVAGFIKVALMLKYRMIPPSLHFQHPNPGIDFSNSPFYVITQLKEWESDRFPLRAGISSFGIGGTNAHAILEEPPPIEIDTGAREWNILMLSAKTRNSLEKASHNLAKFLEQNPGLNIADAAYTLQAGRKHFKYRKMLVCTQKNEAVEILAHPGSGKIYTGDAGENKPTVIFMFSGQGSQYVDMGWGLYQNERVFREYMDRCFDIFKSTCGYDIKETLYPTENRASAAENIKRTGITQPVLFMFEYALAKLLASWEIHPDVMIGYSFGEYTAACLAGVFSLEDALQLIILRGQLMQEMPRGGMLSVPLPIEELKHLLGDRLSIAVDNGPSCIVSGTAEEIDAFEKTMKEKRYICIRVTVSHAGHSAVLLPALSKFEKKVREIKLMPPRVPYISNVTAKYITAAEATDSLYWLKHLKDTVRFGEGIAELLKIPGSVLMEIGPGRDLGVLVRSHKNCNPRQRIISLVRHQEEDIPDMYYLLKGIGHLWLYGGKFAARDFYQDEKRYRIVLPTYPFEGQYFPIDNGALSMKNRMLRINQAPGKNRIEDWIYAPSWKRAPIPPHPGIFADTQRSRIMLFIDECGLGNKLARQLEEEGYKTSIVKKGKRFVAIQEDEYTVNPGENSDLDALLEALQAAGKLPHTIIHLWGVTPPGSEEFDIEQVQQDLENGFYSLIALAQSLGKSNPTAHFQVKVVTNNMQDVFGGEAACPGKAALAGPVKIIPREYNNIACCMIDILLPPSTGKQEQELVAQLVQEFKIETREQVIAYRNHHRWVETFEPVEIGNHGDGSARIREKGVYLISGGLGEMGLLLAEYLARHAKAKLILTGKSPFPGRSDWDNWLSTHSPDEKVSKRIRKIREVEAMGAEVLVFSVDVSKFNLMQQVIKSTEERFGKINGVIHAAGIPDGAMIVRRTREMSKEILAPKITGTLVLKKLLKDTPLDFFILWSSMASILPLPGQTAYAGANAFLDAFAAAKTLNNGTPLISINWDRWQHVGFAVIIENEHKKLWGEELGSGIAASAGIDIFDRILGNPLPRYAVSPMDLRWAVMRDNFYRELSYTAAPVKKTPPGKMRPRPELSTEYVEAQNEIERKLVEAWKNFLGIDQVGIHDNFFELGTTSLGIIQFNSRLKTALDIDIPVAAMYSYPTVALLGKFLERQNSGEGLIDSPQPAYEALEKGKEKIGMLRTKRRSITGNERK